MNTDKFAIPFAVFIAIILISGSLYFSRNKPENMTKNIDVSTNKITGEIRPVSSEDHILGNPDAEIMLVEYSDTECPYCKIFNPTIQKIMAEYGPSGKVAWVYRHFPIAGLHPKAPKEAQATECVNEIGGPTKFWQYLNMIYDKTPGNNGLEPEKLSEFAKVVGIDGAQFDTCLSSNKYEAKVKADYDDAIRSGGVGTPHSFLIRKDGTKIHVNGAEPYGNVRNAVEALLKN